MACQSATGLRVGQSGACAPPSHGLCFFREKQRPLCVVLRLTAGLQEAWHMRTIDRYQEREVYLVRGAAAVCPASLPTAGGCRQTLSGYLAPPPPNIETLYTYMSRYRTVTVPA